MTDIKVCTLFVIICYYLLLFVIIRNYPLLSERQNYDVQYKCLGKSLENKKTTLQRVADSFLTDFAVCSIKIFHQWVEAANKEYILSRVPKNVTHEAISAKEC